MQAGRALQGNKAYKSWQSHWEKQTTIIAFYATQNDEAVRTWGAFKSCDLYDSKIQFYASTDLPGMTMECG